MLVFELRIEFVTGSFVRAIHACFDVLYLFDEFKTKCLRAENRIIRYISSNPSENPVDLLRMISTDKEIVCDGLVIHNLPETETISKHMTNLEELLVIDTKENINTTDLFIVKQEHDYGNVEVGTQLLHCT